MADGGPSFARLCFGWMDLTLEAYSNIVGHVGRRSDITALCRVSKAFRRAAELALYKSIFLENTYQIRDLCVTLANSPRLASLVESLTLSPVEDEEHGHSYEDGDEDSSLHELPDEYWLWISKALANTTRLLDLEIHSQIGPTSACSWIYPKPPVFQLRSLHCDFDWDDDLVTFLNSQHDLEDLYILDFKPLIPSTATNDDTSSSTTSSKSMTIHDTAMPSLTTLECTFSEAADAIVPHRPISRLKTCFSKTEPSAKQAELTRLITTLAQSTRSLRSLDIADSSYNEPFTMSLLKTIVGNPVTSTSLRYLGTLVLPVSGQERLQFYGLLMRLPVLQCIEIEVSEWDPVPSTPAAFRALASELRIYCPSATVVVFVHDFERTVVTMSGGLRTVDDDPYTEHLWREF
ncbi:hypothetical protein CC1G_03084 [Coprinopsis cinerea okayama7|uniref:F-box domain-containing protein n=1 Tax=Coprinopsis cinerea (strain Okayama-7 / 130 / ATCC MYA-4618 / FGSC 9003) TaxID=240176 RepID=A8PEV7_COPC7|nr:hypothetical protein CC1G_03084 [Coprinopsis cinerea okayama7\|eukprot:XP_001840855.2 hypothetical protein CC1G_03084 [Coprinopsis cinerea okayama7\